MDNNTILKNDFDKDYNPPITLKDILYQLFRARWWIVFFSLLFFIISAYVTYSTPPVYMASASVMIEKANKAQKIFNINLENDFKISDEVAVVKSRTIAEDVVESLWNSNMRNRLYIFGTKVFMPKGQRLRRPLRKILSLGSWSPDQSQPPQYDEPYDEEIGKRFYQNIINSLNVHFIHGTNIMQISVSSPHPYESSLIANTVVEIYKKRDKEWSSDESINLKKFLNSRLENKGKEIEVIEDEIKKYKKENRIYDINGNVSNLTNNLESTKSNNKLNDLNINILVSNKKLLKEQLSDLEKDMVSQMLSSINAQLFALRTQVNEKEAELVRNSSMYGDKHEAVLKTKENLSQLKSELENKTNEMIIAGLSIVDPLEYRQNIITQLLNYETELHQLNALSVEYQKLINKYEKDLESIPEKQSYLGNLEREKEVLSNTYAFIRQKMEEARVSMASEPGKVRILNRAVNPRSPISPNISKNLILAIMIGAIFGFGISLIIEYLDSSIRSVEYLETKKLPILAIIPSIGEKINLKKKLWFNRKRRNDQSNNQNARKEVGNLQRRMVTHEDPKSPISEAYRGLRTSLMYTKNGSQGSIMISSPGPGEGKTTTIINLAITYANLGKKTVLVDGDLRKPVIHKVINDSNKLGLTHFLSGVEKNIDSIISSSEIENLDIIYNGAIPPNPSELLGSELMKDCMNKLKQKYDIVLFDAPPIMAVTDAVVLSRLIDQFILVVRCGNTNKNSIDHALNALSNVGTPLSGVVFNDLNQNNSYYYSSYYSYNQYYYSS